MTKQPLLFVLFSLLNLTSGEEEEFTCGIWLAKSTIPGAGLGIFAGKDFKAKDSVLPVGDVVIPLLDMKLHQNNHDNFLWDEYTWDGVALFMEKEGLHGEQSAASPGFGASVNCFMDLTNIKETIPINTNTGLHRSKDPGVGAFSTYWNRESIASKSIKAGNELFASYGNSWFVTREESIGPVPLKGDLKRANKLIGEYLDLEQSLESQVKKEILEEVWESFAWKTPWDDTSRVMFAVPKNWEETRLAGNITLTLLKQRHHSVSVEWLEEHGECGDLITVKPSTLVQAGRGAFSRTLLTEGEVVAPFPLIHIPYRSRLDMFEVSRVNTKRGYSVDKDKKVQTQLIENYCMGHSESTMLLCPYGTLSSHINHNQTMANVKMVWADPEKSNHQPSWLNKTLKQLYETPHAGLAMTLVATRDIQPDEEIFLDYGEEWESAWQQHVENYVPVDGAEDYKSAEQLNNELKIVKTEFELMFSPYPPNVKLYFSKAFTKPRHIWVKYWKQGTLQEYMEKEDEYFIEVDVLRREVDKRGNTWWYVVPRDHGPKEKEKLIKPKIISKVPLEAFKFFDQAYTTDFTQPNAFRHDMRIPNHLFPEVWRNRKSGDEIDPPDSHDDETQEDDEL